MKSVRRVSGGDPRLAVTAQVSVDIFSFLVCVIKKNVGKKSKNLNFIFQILECECNNLADSCNRENGSCFCRTRGAIGNHCQE